MVESQGEVTKPERGKRSRYSLAFWTNIGVANAIVIGVAVVLVHGGIRTTAITWAGASLALGGMLGFLFGIPGRQQGTVQINQPGVAAIDTDIKRVTGTGGTSIQDAGTVNAPEGTITLSPDTSAEKPAVPANGRSVGNSTQDFHSEPSNLEQVSDWVTKLLLGGGLTQLQQIPRMVWELSYSVAIGIAPKAKGQDLWSEQAFASGLLIYFFVAGFFGGYLITKLQLGRRLRS